MTKEQLVTNLRYGRKMEPFVQRLRAGLKDYDPISPQMNEVMEGNRSLMKHILLKKKISERKAEKAIDEAIAIALDQRLEPLRRNRYLSAREAEQKEINRLITAIDELKKALSKLDVEFRRELNKTTAKQDWSHFDGEILVEFIQSISETISKLSPDPVPNGTRSAKPTLLGSIRKVVRTEGPKIIRLWETITPATRNELENSVRRRSPGTSAVEVLRHLHNALGRYKQQSKKPPGITRIFGYRIAKLWRGLGLRTGRVYYNGTRTIDASHRESNFQSFCRMAMAAVGGSSKISSRHILRLNLERRQGKTVLALRS